MAPELYSFQQLGRKFLRDKRRAILADEMGLGKTPQAIKAAEISDTTRILVICPKTAKRVWVNELLKWAPHSTFISLEKRHEIVALSIAKYQIVIVHYELARLAGLDLLKFQWTHIICDEAHRLKNRKAQVTKAVRTLALKNISAILWFLTGTPLLNRADEIWTLLNMIDPKIYSSYWAFVNKKMNIVTQQFGRVTVRMPKGLIDPEGFKNELKPILLRRLKSEVLKELPPVTLQTIPVFLDGKQRSTYLSMYANLYAEVAGKEIAAQNALVKLIRLRQIAISADLLDLSSESLEGAKLDAILDFLEDLDDQLLIYSTFAQGVRRLSKILLKKGYSVVGFDGDSSEKERHEAQQAIQTKQAQLFWSTVGAGGESVTLTSANKILFIDKDWTPARNDQVIGRIDRITQLNPMTVYNLLAKRTVEEKIEQMISVKRDLFDKAVPVTHILGEILSNQTGEWDL